MSAKKVSTDTGSKTDKIKCLRCTVEKAPSSTNFYVNTNSLFSSEKLEICKDCILKYIGNKDSIGYLNRVKSILAIMDKPFIAELWELRGEEWSRYIPQLSSFHQYKGMSFGDSIFTTKTMTNTEHIDDDSTDYTTEDIKDLSSLWGKGKTLEDYLFLQNEYEKLINAYESDDSYAMQILFQEAAQQRLTIKKLREDSKSVDKELKTLQDLLGSANIKPVQETGANATEQETFGTLIKKYEFDKPIPEPDPEWQDVDGIKKYYQVWFLGHLCKMLGINNEYSQIYEDEMNKYTVDIPEYESDEDDAI